MLMQWKLVKVINMDAVCECVSGLVYCVKIVLILH